MQNSPKIWSAGVVIEPKEFLRKDAKELTKHLCRNFIYAGQAFYEKLNNLQRVLEMDILINSLLKILFRSGRVFTPLPIIE